MTVAHSLKKVTTAMVVQGVHPPMMTGQKNV